MYRRPVGRGEGVDGDFGMFTDQAVRLLQTRARIRVDGVAGPQTYRVLGMT